MNKRYYTTVLGADGCIVWKKKEGKLVGKIKKMLAEPADNTTVNAFFSHLFFLYLLYTRRSCFTWIISHRSHVRTRSYLYIWSKRKTIRSFPHRSLLAIWIRQPFSFSPFLTYHNRTCSHARNVYIEIEEVLPVLVIKTHQIGHQATQRQINTVTRTRMLCTTRVISRLWLSKGNREVQVFVYSALICQFLDLIDTF